MAAMAYGVEEISSVDKIVGPGNLFVAASPSGRSTARSTIDSIAGPE